MHTLHVYLIYTSTPTHLTVYFQGRLSDIKTKKERADLKLNILLLSDYGLNGVDKTTKIVLDDYLEFNHTQYIIQRGGSCVLVPFALRVSVKITCRSFL